MEKFLDVLDYLLAYTQYHALIPGKIETWNVIIDAKDVSVFEFPVASLGSMVKRIIADYKVRGNHMIAVNTHWLLAKAVNFVQPMLSPRVAGKTFLFTNDYHDHLDALIGKARLEQKFGGELPNVESNFFPPRYN
uniref:CRAL-TRIO domain-containing protein n=1 Tax=Favella ehrenbergii TaxID=182087 RepID=A0A7S3MNX5_9SPIT|mmetsp:Transcript_35623/g.46882  ORF Transcript_35623/g.46882 Transcript_35623/m.46882 type:complete len:135 (+) Transcript_35623:796-1200(+)|eukprot:Macronucleus_7461.p1 GENE.Macronucleus_7461~~Macronucleus_7461.p1  ORF type:complete len:135 (+),score=23.93 Macronucleus_7461:1-405(+)